MPIEFFDTNIIIRYATQDDPIQFAKALAYLQQLERGDRQATTCEGVLVEAVQVLESKRTYAFPRVNIQGALSYVVRLRGLRLAHKAVYIRALDLYAATNLDFVDCLNVAHMERAGISTVISFDRGYDRVPSVTRAEP